MNLLTPPPLSLLVLSTALSLPLLALALWRAPWRELAAVPIRQHAFYLCCTGLPVFWLMQVEVRELLAFHPLLISLVTMLFGLRLALVCGALATAGQHLLLYLIGDIPLWATLPTDYLLQVAGPALCTRAVIVLINYLPVKNPFTYFLGVGFFGAGLSIQAMSTIALLLFWLSGSDVMLKVLLEHYLVTLLLMFPEGFANGTLATLLTVLHPDLLRTYRDDWFTRD